MRSASTSVTEAIIKESGLPRHSVSNKLKRVAGYEHYPSSTASIIGEDMLIDWVCSRKYVIQEHLLPLPEHRQILLSIPEEKRKIVVLKRDWEDSFNSQMNRVGHCPYGSRGINKESCRMSFKKFREDLEIYFPEKDGYLHVEFENLIKNKTEILSNILNYYGIIHDKEYIALGNYRCDRT
tara:strand:+ start:25 stop:567 length:543 start_codon:yes stop_codon:yes gene_type:complete